MGLLGDEILPVLVSLDQYRALRTLQHGGVPITYSGRHRLSFGTIQGYLQRKKEVLLLCRASPKPMIYFRHVTTFDTGQTSAGIYRLSVLEDAGLAKIDQLPYSIRVLLESVLRNCDGYTVREDDVKNLAAWSPTAKQVEIPFLPSRVVLQDFTGVPAVVDLAAMRSAMHRMGGDPKKVNPLIPVDLVIDHSVQVDRFGTSDALELNVDLEFTRNKERYEFLRWGQNAFDNFRAVPPNVGIVHQVNLEFLAKCVFLREDSMGSIAIPDTLVGTDSHTTMINGLGVVGWGVGGIEAEGVMLGQPIYILMPEVVGFGLTGELASRRNSDGHGTYGHRDPAAGRCGREIRRILWIGCFQDVPGRPCNDRQYGSGIWRDNGLFPRRR